MGISAVIAVVGLGLSAKGQRDNKKASKKSLNAQREAQVAQQTANDAAYAQREKANKIQQNALAEQNKLEKRKANVLAQRSRVQSIREARIKRGQLVQGAALSGTQGSSGEIGASSSISSQLTGNLAFGNTMTGIATEMGQNNLDTQGALGDVNLALSGISNTNSAAQASSQTAQAKASSDGATASAIGGLGSSIFNAAGGFKTIFSAGQPKPPVAPSFKAPSWGNLGT